MDAARLIREARRDAGISQRELAERSGMKQSNIAAIESGRRKVSPELLRSLLEASDYRPSLALENAAAEVVAAAERLGFANVRVFGSVAIGTDRHRSDIDLLVDPPGERLTPFALGAFTAEAESLTGFPVDVVLDRGDSPYLRRIRREAVAV
jgi:transcriptional regulator with XRE-family HTH domain